MYSEEDFLPLSGLQHFLFCRRQWALIHIEQQWAENIRTAEGRVMHERAHREETEKRGNKLTVRALRISSAQLGLSGQCDVVEFIASEEGTPLPGREGQFTPYPIEYKRGKSKLTDEDRAQLCAQAMCLEEMLACSVPEGALFYGENRRREVVRFTDELRKTVADAAAEMHAMHTRGYTPKVKTGTFCKSCSLSEICLPKLMKTRPVSEYLEAAICEDC